MIQKYFLQAHIFSALILFGTFFSPSYFFIGSLFFCIPLFVRIIQKNDLTWVYGFVWGIVFFSLHWLVLIPLLYSRAYGIARMILYLLLVFYASCWTSIWFFCMSLFARQKKFFAMVFITWMYFYLWENYGFFFIDKKFSYCLGSPLLSLNHIFGWRYILGFCHVNVLLLVIIFGQYFLSVWLITSKNYTQLFVFIFFIWVLFLSTILFQRFIQNVDYSKQYNHIVHIKPLEINSADYWIYAEQLCIKFEQAIQKYTDCRMLVMPESSFPFALNRHIDVIDFWSERILGKNIGLIIGAHRQEGGDLFNSMYYIKNGHIIYVYDKKKLVPYAEYIPFYAREQKIMQDLFLRHSHAFSPATEHADDVFVIDDLHLEPKICFDFFHYFPEKKINESCFILLLNESWFSFTYIQHLFFLYACFISSYLQVTIFYIAYHTAYVIHPLYYIRLCSQ